MMTMKVHYITYLNISITTFYKRSQGEKGGVLGWSPLDVLNTSQTTGSTDEPAGGSGTTMELDSLPYIRASDIAEEERPRQVACRRPGNEGDCHL